MQNRWAVMSAAGEWSRDANDKVLTFIAETNARAHCDGLNAASDGGWTTEEFTVEDALEEATRSPFAGEGGL